MEAKPNEKRLSGQVAWVTGSSRGIGRVIADHLASLGAKVAVHGTGPHLHPCL
jgi:3-oxoacyl-[acyl-carrier protein] reductase